jgi:hypothetical protein
MLVEKEGIIYEVLQAKDLEQTIARIGEVFTRGEPTTIDLGITLDEFYRFAEVNCKKAIKEGLSVIARDKETHKVIGFSIAEDLTSEPPEGIETINVKFKPVMALLKQLDDEYKKSHKVEKWQILRLVMAGVSEHYEGRGIVTKLIEENLKLAKLKNFSGAIAEVTGLASQHITRDKLGFKEKFAIEYKSFTYKGKNVFKNIKTPQRCILIEKRF